MLTGDELNPQLGFERDEEQLKKNNEDHTKWSNVRRLSFPPSPSFTSLTNFSSSLSSQPLEIQLPNAPNMKMFCLYGTGKETERGYFYSQGASLQYSLWPRPSPLFHPRFFSLVVSPPGKRIHFCYTASPSSVFIADPFPPFLPRPEGGYEHDEVPVVDFTASAAPGSNPVSLEPNMTNSTTPRPPLDLPLQRRVFIDNSVSMHEQNIPRIRSGVVFNDGDGTVSILSLGAMCVEGWKVRFSSFSLFFSLRGDSPDLA